MQMKWTLRILLGVVTGLSGLALIAFIYGRPPMATAASSLPSHPLRDHVHRIAAGAVVAARVGEPMAR